MAQSINHQQSMNLAKQVVGSFVNVPVITDISTSVVKLCEIYPEIKHNKKKCLDIIDATLTKANVILQSSMQLSELAAKGENMTELLEVLSDFGKLLQEIYVEMKAHKNLFRKGKKMLDEYQLRIESFDVGKITTQICSRCVSGDTLQTMKSVENEQLKNEHQPTSGLTTSVHVGAFTGARNAVNNGIVYVAGRDMTVFAQANNPPPITTYAHMLPPKPLYMFEREEQLKSIVSTLLAKSSYISILGDGGMGKTTLAVAVMHDSQICELYVNRYIIFCEGILMVDSLWPELARILGIPTEEYGARLPTAVLDILKQKKTLLYFDNFETVWESDNNRPKAEDFLAYLTAVPSLSIMLTMRGTQRPAKVHWSLLLPPLTSLSISGSQQIVNVLAGPYSDDIIVAKLLIEVDGIPLAVTLLANLLQEGNETPLSLLKRWESEKTSVIETGSKNRQSSLDFSIKLSIESSRMKSDPNAVNLLALFSLLPDGFSDSNETLDKLEILITENINIRKSISTLCRMALITINNAINPPRIKILSPIRHFSQHHLKVPPQLQHALIELYVGLIPFFGVGDITDTNLYAIILSEIHNTEYILKTFVSAISPLKLAETSINFTKWAEYLCFPTTTIIQLAIDQCLGLPETLANCFSCLANVYFHQYEFEEAEKALTQAQKLHQQAQDVLGEAYDLKSLGHLYLRRDELREAEKALTQAQKLHQQAQDVLGEAYDLKLLGDLYLRRDELGEAEKALTQAQKLHQQAQDVLGEANDLQSLGDLYLHWDELGEAEKALTQAQKLHQQAQDVLGEANDLQSLGDLYLRRNKLREAEKALTQAQKLHQQAHSVLGEAYDLKSLGDLYLRQHKLGEAEKALTQAQKLHQQAHSVLGEANDLKLLGDLYLCQHKLGEAEKALTQAQKLHQQAHSVLGEANNLKSLGDLYLRRNELGEAEKALTQAQKLHQQAHSVLGEANDLKSLGHLYLCQHELGDSEKALTQAQKLHQQSQDVLGESGDNYFLGKLYLHSHKPNDAENAANKCILLSRRAQNSYLENLGHQLLLEVKESQQLIEPISKNMYTI